MPRSTASITQAQMQRAIKAALAAGLTVAECVATKDGIRIITSNGVAGQGGKFTNPWDEELTDGATG